MVLAFEQENLRWRNLDKLLLRSSPFAYETQQQMVKNGTADSVCI